MQADTGSSAVSHRSLSVLQVCEGGLSVLSVVRLILGAFQYDCATVFVGSVGESSCKSSILFKCRLRSFIIRMGTKTMIILMLIVKMIIARDFQTYMM